MPVHEYVRVPTQIPERRTWHNMRSYFSLLHRSVFQQQRFSDAIFTPTGSVFSSIATPDDCFHFPRGVVFYINSEGKKTDQVAIPHLGTQRPTARNTPRPNLRRVEPTIRLGLAMDSRSTIRAPVKHRLLESRQTLNEGGLRYLRTTPQEVMQHRRTCTSFCRGTSTHRRRWTVSRSHASTPYLYVEIAEELHPENILYQNVVNTLSSSQLKEQTGRN